MTSTARTGFLAVSFAVGAAMAAVAATATTYILNGYNLSGVHGVNAAELEAKLKHHKGARITRSDVDADTAIVANELKARHIEGQLFTTLAEEHGRVWVIFDVLNPPTNHLEAQKFEGASHVSAATLATATGLKVGDQLSREKLGAARRAIVALYAKSLPGKKVTVKARLQARRDKIVLTWIIGEPK